MFIRITLLAIPLFLISCQTADLLRASGRGNIDLIESSLKSPDSNINEKDEKGRNAAIWATSGGQIEAIDYLAKKGIDFNAADNEGNTALHYAVYKKRKNIIEKLLSYKADTEIQNKAGETALTIAIKMNSMELIKVILTKANVNGKDGDGWTAFHYAVHTDNKELLDLLIGKKADINAQDKDGFTPLMLAVKEGKYALVRHLLSLKANPAIKTKQGASAYSLALMNNYPEIAKIIRRYNVKTDPWDDILLASYDGDSAAILKSIKAGAPASLVTTNLQSTPLMFAGRTGKPQAVRLLLKAKINPETKSQFGQTAMFDAIGADRKDIADEMRKLMKPNPTDPAELLLEAIMQQNESAMEKALKAGASINAKNSMGETPLMLAVIHKKEKIIAPLLASGASVTERNRNGMTALNFASDIENPKIVTALVAAKSPLDIADEVEGKTAIFRAVIKNDLESAKVMVGAGANVNIKDLSLNSPVIFCAVNNRIDMLKTLQPSADFNIRDTEGKAALHWAIQKGNFALLQYLLSIGVFRDPKDKFGFTPLIMAVRFRNMSFAKMLLESRADANQQDGRGYTALMYAAEANDVAAIELLLANNAQLGIRNFQRKTALGLAKEKNAKDATSVLQMRGATE